MLIRPWIVEEEAPLLTTRIFRIQRVLARSPAKPDLTGTFVYLDSADWVNVVAVTPAGELICVEQYRHGTRRVTLEIPGGLVDPGEDFLAAGARELREETGYAGDPPVLLGIVEPNPAIQNNRCGTLLIQNARRVGEQEPDLHEELAVRLIPGSAVDEVIRTGQINHALVIAGLMHWRLWQAAGR